MSVSEISITGEDGDYVLIADISKGYNGRIHKSLIADNGLTVIDGKTSISDILYQAWFVEDIKKATQKEQIIDSKKFSNKFLVQFDYPLNKEGKGVSTEFFSENEETARIEVLEGYKEQFGTEATGKIIKFLRYRRAEEVEQFCIEKYGTAFPNKIECGYILWTHVPFFAMPYSPMGMKMIPYLEIDDVAKEKDIIRKKMEEHSKTYPTLNGKKVFIHGSSKETMEKYFEKHPELKRFMEPVIEYRKIHRKLLDELTSVNDTKLLTPEQLELLGINFDPYEHKYQGGKAFIEVKGKRMGITPDFGKVEQ